MKFEEKKIDKNNTLELLIHATLCCSSDINGTYFTAQDAHFENKCLFSDA